MTSDLEGLSHYTERLHRQNNRVVAIRALAASLLLLLLFVAGASKRGPTAVFLASCLAILALLLASRSGTELRKAQTIFRSRQTFVNSRIIVGDSPTGAEFDDFSAEALRYSRLRRQRGAWSPVVLAAVAVGLVALTLV